MSDSSGLSFGVELEFLVPIRLDNKDPDAATPGLPAIIADERFGSWIEADAAKRPLINMDAAAIERVATALLAGGVPVQGRRRPENADSVLPAANTVFASRRGWVVALDTSMYEPRQPLGTEYHWIGMEVKSPALYDMPSSFHHVQYVVSTLIRTVRIRVNITAGLHCHVGYGCMKVERGDEYGVDRINDIQKAAYAALSRWLHGDDDELNGTASLLDHSVSEKSGVAPDATDGPITDDKQAENEFVDASKPFPLHHLKKIATLAWAMDGVMSHIHPPERAFSLYAHSIRRNSSLAVNYPETSFTPGWSVARHGKAGSSPTELRLSDARFPALRADEEADAAAADVFRQLRCATPVPSGAHALTKIAEGVARIQQCDTHAKVASLLCTPCLTAERLNYNFAAYHPHSERRTRTVEFREATGSMDPEWVGAWARIAVGVVRFCRDATAPRFRAVLSRLVAAEAANVAGLLNDYDVVHFLQDLGLFADALLLEKRLRSDPASHWYPNDNMDLLRERVYATAEQAGEQSRTRFSWEASMGSGSDTSRRW